MINKENNTVYYEIAKKLNDIYKDVDTYSEIFEIEKKQAEEEVKLFTEYKLKAIQGIRPARDYIVNQFTIMMTSKYLKINDDKLRDIINFEQIQKNEVQVLFEMLLFVHDISDLLNNYVVGFWTVNSKDIFKITEDNVRAIAKREESSIKQVFQNKINRLKLLATFIYAKEYGQDIIDTLQYHNINEIGFLGVSYIYLIYKGNKVLLEFLKFENEGILLSIQKKTTSRAKPQYDEQNPAIVASKLSGSRITVAGYDATPTDEELFYNERIFNLVKISLEDMRDRYNTINDIIYKFLCFNQEGRGCYFVTGSDMAIGKSTFLLAMLGKTPDNWGIGILDTQNELQARRKFPRKNIITLIQNAKLSFAQLFAIMLKMARDVLIVGEITLPEEVAELIKSALRLNAGVGGTLHSMSPYETVPNLRNLCLLTDMYNSADVAEADISRGIDLIVHLARHPKEPGRIVVESVVEIEYLEQNVFANIKKEGNFREKLENLIEMAQLAVQKYLYKKCYRYNDIFKFDYENGEWVAIRKPSDTYINKLSRYIDKNEYAGFVNNVNWTNK